MNNKRGVVFNFFYKLIPSIGYLFLSLIFIFDLFTSTTTFGSKVISLFSISAITYMGLALFRRLKWAYLINILLLFLGLISSIQIQDLDYISLVITLIPLPFYSEYLLPSGPATPKHSKMTILYILIIIGAMYLANYSYKEVYVAQYDKIKLITKFPIRSQMSGNSLILFRNEMDPTNIKGQIFMSLCKKTISPNTTIAQYLASYNPSPVNNVSGNGGPVMISSQDAPTNIKVDEWSEIQTPYMPVCSDLYSTTLQPNDIFTPHRAYILRSNTSLYELILFNNSAPPDLIIRAIRIDQL